MVGYGFHVIVVWFVFLQAIAWIDCIIVKIDLVRKLSIETKLGAFIDSNTSLHVRIWSLVCCESCGTWMR